jgi:glycosyltransferase involved in cell wall biosynthesis
MNPRVVILTPYFRPVVGGVESNARRLARYFSFSGLDVTVLTKRLTRDLPDTEELDGARVVRIGPHGQRSPGGKWRMLPAVTSWLVNHRRDHDVVCSIDCRGVGLGALAARLISGCPVIAQPQTTGVLAPDGRRGATTGLKWALGGVYGRSDAIACIARVIEREALSRGIPAERVHFLPNAIDMTRYRVPSPDERSVARRRLGVSEQDVVFAFVGRLSREKGVMDLLEAWRLMGRGSDRGDCPTSPTARLLVAGPDMEGHEWDVGSEARSFVERHRLGDTVRFMGPTDDVPGLMHAADVAVQPSHFEALGLSAIEALACGVPVVASAVGGLVDFVFDGVNGLRCPPQQPAALAACLESLASDAVRRQRLAAQARASVEQQYDERAVFGRFEALVRALARRRDQPAVPVT